jgi:putative flippase GtrA
MISKGKRELLQLTKYYSLAGIASAVDFLIFYFMVSSGFPIAAAALFSTAAGITLGYLLTRNFVFQGSKTLKTFSKYLFVALCALLAATSFIPLLAQLLDSEWLAKLLWMGVQALLQFQVHRQWTFVDNGKRGRAA